ncbi:transcriptional regulator [Zhongshania marina]|uniref:Transcriptional regulator n=1 Tax=Zhongshania marina TaxID=2304603 RepID=A0A2S4HC43_9GAMM|nr:transcriptional regulator [Marortus luteolus]POP51576.1 transcriptional regulator [Marortus luteolus]
MDFLPKLSSIEDALLYWKDEQPAPVAIAAYVAGFLQSQGISNKRSREMMGVNKTYTMTHYRRVGTKLSRTCIEIWLNNPERIGLGHVRAISSMPEDMREKAVRNLLANSKIAVRDLERIAKGKEPAKDVDIARLERAMSESVGYPVSIRWRRGERKGLLSVQFYSLDDLDALGKKLGYNASGM